MGNLTKPSKDSNPWLTGLAWAAAAGAGWWAWQRLNASTGPLFRMRSRQPETAMVTGASSGIGAAFARRLAGLGYDLVLVARREERLKELAAELSEGHGIHVETLVADLSKADDLAKIENRAHHSSNLTVLVNNAGFGTGRDFLEIEPDVLERMVRVHITASLRLTRAALPGMITRARGAVVNVSSVAGFMALPGSANYCASKSYLTTFSKSLHRELEGTGVIVTALCPGLTRTEFHSTPEFKPGARDRAPAYAWMSANEVVDSAVRGLERGQSVIVPGLVNQLVATVLTTPLAEVLEEMVFSRRKLLAD